MAPAKKTTAAKKAVKKAPAKKVVTRPRTRSPLAKPVVRQLPSARTVAKPKTQKNDLLLEGLWDDELTTQYPSFKKNNFLSLIVLALGGILVLVGIYIQVNKSEPETTIFDEKSNEITQEVPATGSVATGKTTPAPVEADTKTGTFAVDAQRVVENFYTFFNNGEFDKISPMYDVNFQNVANLRTYFGVKRLEKRKANLVGDLLISEVNAVIDHPFVQKNPNAMVVQYKTSYILKSNGLQYQESWYAYILKYNGGYKLNGFECQENCAASPFFQLR